MMLTQTLTKTARMRERRKVAGRERYMHGSCNYFSCGEHLLVHDRLDEDSLGMDNITRRAVLQVHPLRVKSAVQAPLGSLLEGM
jgi:hypothetical protein